MQKLKKAELEKWMKMEGKVRGSVFQSDRKYVLEKMGEEGWKKLEKRAKELGVELPHRTAKATAWYPMGLIVISGLLEREIFSWTDEEIREAGRVSARTSFIVKLLMKFFVSLEKFVEKIPQYWRMHFDIGELEVKKIDKENKELILHLKGVKFPQVFLISMEGFYQQMFEFILGRGKVKESKFTVKEDFYEYHAKW